MTGDGVSTDRASGAFFDLDHTLLAGSSLYHLAVGMASHGLVSWWELVRHGWWQVEFLLAGENPVRIARTQEKALAWGSGRRLDELVEFGEWLVDHRIMPRIRADVRALADAHRAAGEPVWLVTAAPAELAALLAARLGFTGGLGTVAEVRDGAWTGRLVGDLLHGPAKATAVVALAASEGLALERCSAYSDSVNDLPLLELVGRPYAVDPDLRLRRIALDRGWPVLDFGGRLSRRTVHEITRLPRAAARRLPARSPRSGP